MTFGEYGEWSHGGVNYPLVAATTNPLLKDADPSLSLALDFYAASLDLHIGARLKAQAALHGIVIAHAVAKKLAVEPTPQVLADNFVFPLFALYRVSTTEKEHTVHWNKDVGEWAFAYVLPVMGGRQIAELGPILRSVERTINHATRQGFEPSYQGGADIWTLANLMSIRVKDVRYAPFETIDQQNGSFRGVTGTIEIIERDMSTAGAFQDFTGASITVGNKVPNQSVAPDIALASGLPPATISTVSPSSGSKAGGTAITIGGTNFRAGSRLSIGRVNVPVTIVNATTATAVTPPHEASPDYMADVVLVDPFGQTARKPAGFTFTSP